MTDREAGRQTTDANGKNIRLIRRGGNIIQKSKLANCLNIHHSEILDRQTCTPNQRCDQVPVGNKYHLPIKIHPKWLCICEKSSENEIRYLKALLCID